MRHPSIAVTTRLPDSQCCECGHRVTSSGGPDRPLPGDFTLCIRCGSLNVFAEELTLRAPTDEELLEAAVNSDLQEMRRAILRMHK